MARQTAVNTSITPELDAFLQLKMRLEKGAAQAEQGDLLDGAQAFYELREMIQARTNRVDGPELAMQKGR